MRLFLNDLIDACGNDCIEEILSNCREAVSDTVNDLAEAAVVTKGINYAVDEVINKAGCAERKEYDGKNRKKLDNEIDKTVKTIALLFRCLLLVLGLLVLGLLILGLLILRLLVGSLILVLVVHNNSPFTMLIL